MKAENVTKMIHPELEKSSIKNNVEDWYKVHNKAMDELSKADRFLIYIADALITTGNEKLADELIDLANIITDSRKKAQDAAVRSITIRECRS